MNSNPTFPTLIPKSGPLSVLYILPYFNTLVVPVFLSTHLYYTTSISSRQSLPSIINKTFTNIFPSWFSYLVPISSHSWIYLPSNTLPFPFPLKTNYPHVYGFFIWEPQGSINEKRFDGDPNEVRGRGEKTESFRAKEGVWGNLVPQIYMILERITNLDI